MIEVAITSGARTKEKAKLPTGGQPKYSRFLGCTVLPRSHLKHAYELVGTASVTASALALPDLVQMGKSVPAFR